MKYHQILNQPYDSQTFTKNILVKSSETLNLETVMEFTAPNTTGNTLIKAVVMPGGNLTLKGLIRINQQAINSQAFLKHSVLLIGNGSQAVSVPELEISNDQVQASHASAIGPVDQSQLFYLMSRGFSKSDALDLIIKSFLEI
ncbi:MAG: SufD family Fe-S cluster assembly protein [Candidatus Shapirobacteria bacterium]|nr:SufD family Fe-S cluster assembly protein [Candidatus Shapirobacteria bacterium]